MFRIFNEDDASGVVFFHFLTAIFSPVCYCETLHSVILQALSLETVKKPAISGGPGRRRAKPCPCLKARNTCQRRGKNGAGFSERLGAVKYCPLRTMEFKRNFEVIKTIHCIHCSLVAFLFTATFSVRRVFGVHFGARLCTSLHVFLLFSRAL